MHIQNHRFSGNSILIFRALKFSREDMGPIVFHSNSVFCFPAFSFITKQSKMRNPIFSLRGNLAFLPYFPITIFNNHIFLEMFSRNILLSPQFFISMPYQ